MHHSHKHIDKLHKSSKKNAFHYIVLASSVIYPLSTIPQIVNIFSSESAENISLTTYIFYMIFTIIFLSYGFSEKLKPIIVLQSLWFLMYGSVLVGIFIYG